MRIIAYLLSIYLLSLCFVPCGDKHEYMSLEQAVIGSHAVPLGESSKLATEHGDESSQTKHEYCSPLCTCACCSILFQQAVITQLDFQIFGWEREFLVSHHTIIFARELEAVWQPPRFIS